MDEWRAASQEGILFVDKIVEDSSRLIREELAGLGVPTQKAREVETRLMDGVVSRWVELLLLTGASDSQFAYADVSAYLRRRFGRTREQSPWERPTAPSR